MTTGLPALRALVIYGLCVPLALMVGYLLANPLDWTTIGFFGVVVAVLCTPLLLKWHYTLLVLSLNLSMVAFLPGRPEMWLVCAVLSFTFSVLQLTLSRQWHFLHVPAITKPLLFLLVVVFVTAKFTGGIGFNAFGGENMGGKRYVTMFAAVMACFALGARRIPLTKAGFYVALFFLSGTTMAISSLAHFVPAGATFIFYLFPPESIPGVSSSYADADGMLRLGGVGNAALAVISFLLARYGLRDLLFSGRLWRPLVFFGCVVLSLFGGFRMILVTILLYLVIQAYLEGLFKSRFMPILALGLVLVAAIGLPFATRLPMSVQRALSVLPVQVAPEAREAARMSSEWRIRIWHEVLPQVPQYLLLGKGFGISAQDMNQATAANGLGAEGGTILAGDYHNGPLSLIIPLGIWGVLGFLWLLWVGGRLLYDNFRYGDPALLHINTFLLACFLSRVIIFCFVFGGFYGDLVKFTGLLGLSIALNGGRCRPAEVLNRRQVNLKFHGALRSAPAAAHLKPRLSSPDGPVE